MSEDGEVWAALRAESQQKKRKNKESSLQILKSKGVVYQCLSEGAGHYRIGEYDIWLSTGKFVHRPTGKYGRGIYNLLKKI